MPSSTQPTPKHREHSSSPMSSHYTSGTSSVSKELVKHANSWVLPGSTGPEVLEVGPRNPVLTSPAGDSGVF